jgi:hypothetical protein
MANTLRFKRGLVATIPTAVAGEPLFTTDTFDLYIGNGTTNTRFQKYIASGTTSQLLRGDGSLLTMPIVLTSPSNGQVLKYNGTNWVNDSDAGVTGSGTTNYLPKFTGTSTIGNSQIFDNGTYVGIGTTSPATKLEIVGASGLQVRNGAADGFSFQQANTNTWAWTGLTAGSNYIIQNANVGIGTSNPAAKFVVSNAGASGLEIDPIGGIGSGVLFQAYNRSTSAYMAQSYYALSHTFNVGSGGATRVLDITSAGNVGIGTTSPARALHVLSGVGTAQIQSSGTTSHMYFGDVNSSVIDNQGIGSVGNNLWFSAGGLERLRITSGGNVGIGTTSPSQKLHLLDGIARFDNVGTQLILGTSGVAGSYEFAVSTGNVFSISLSGVGERMRLTSGGNLLVGTTSSAGYLIQANGSIASTNSTAGQLYSVSGTRSIGIQSFAGDWNYLRSNGANLVFGTQDANTLYIRTNDVDRLTIASTGAATFSSSVTISGNNDLIFRDSSTYISSPATDTLRIITANNERMRITSGGNLLVGTTADSGFRLDVNGTARVSGVLTVLNSSSEPVNVKSSAFVSAFILDNTNANLWGGNYVVRVNGVDKNYFGTLGSLLGTTNTDATIWATSGNGFRVYTNGNNRRFEISSTGAAEFTSTLSATKGYFLDSSGAGAVLEVYNTVATNATTAIIRQTGAGGNGNQDIGLLVDIQGANDSDRIANFRYYNGSTYTSRMVITRGGNVGIGNTSASARLHVTGNILSYTEAANTASLFISANNSYNWQFGIGNNSNFVITEGGGLNAIGTTRLTILSGGSVGIGTTSPSAILHTSVTTNGTSVGALLSNPNQAGTADAVSINFGLGRTADAFLFNIPAVKFGKEQQWTSTGSTVDGYLSFSTMLNETVAERLRITSGGNVGIGRSAPDYLLEVNDSIKAFGQFVSEVNGTVGANFYGTGQIVSGASDQPSLYLDTTWNTTGNARGIEFNVNNTSSGASSKLLNLKVDNATMFNVSKGGAITTSAPTGYAAKPYKLGEVLTNAATADRSIVVEIDGTVYYLLASTTAP